MKLYIRIFALALSLTLVLSVSCSDRGTNTSLLDGVEISEGGRLLSTHVFFDELLLQIRNQFQLLELAAYQPRVSFAPIYGGQGRPVPLLILLAPQGGDEYFYFNHGLQQLADEMITKGEIQPMAIVCVSNDPVFGGYFYASHEPYVDESSVVDSVRNPGSGDYDALLGDALIEYIYDSYCPFAINEPDKRGIGGVGQGAYGAFRAALLNPGVFSSISAVDGPLDFDGSDGNGGFQTLFDDVIAEQGITDGNLSNFDSTAVPGSDLTHLFIGGSMVFSPHDTLVTCNITYYPARPPVITVASREVISDVTTLVDHIIREDNFNLDFHLPFDGNGQAYDPIWEGCWLPNNLENILAMEGSTLAGVDIWVGTSSEAPLGYHEQTTSWISTLIADGCAVNTFNYTGYAGNPSDGDEYVYDLLREMLIFHSESFGQ